MTRTAINDSAYQERKAEFLRRVKLLVAEGTFPIDFMEQANAAVALINGCGFDAISANDTINRIVKMPLDYIRAWRRGENRLEWIDPVSGVDYRKA